MKRRKLTHLRSQSAVDSRGVAHTVDWFKPIREFHGDHGSYWRTDRITEVGMIGWDTLRVGGDGTLESPAGLPLTFGQVLFVAKKDKADQTIDAVEYTR